MWQIFEARGATMFFEAVRKLSKLVLEMVILFYAKKANLLAWRDEPSPIVEDFQES